MRTSLFFILVIFLSGCAISVKEVDPRFAAYEKAVQTNLSHSAILGIWQRRLDEGGIFVSTQAATSLLFRSDGTYLRSSKTRIRSSAGDNHEIKQTPDGKPVSGRWTYLGDGVWQPAELQSTPLQGHTHVWRLTPDVLLETITSGGEIPVVLKYVYHRSR